MPNLAITLGVGTLLEAKHLVLIVSGAAKAQILRRALEEPASAEVPASWLRRAGKRLQVIADQEAARDLSLMSPNRSGRTVSSEDKRDV